MRSRLRISVAVLLVAASAVFAIGVVVERSQPDQHEESTQQHTDEPGAAPEGSQEREAQERRERSEITEADEENPEELFGVNTESVGLVIAAIAVSLLLAVAALTVRSPLVLGLIFIVALGAAVFDIREVMHQVDESRDGVATLAMLTAVLHVLTALVAAAALSTERNAGALENVSRPD